MSERASKSPEFKSKEKRVGSPDNLKDAIKTLIFDLDDIENEIDDVQKMAVGVLDTIDVLLNNLESGYPNDPEITLLKGLYDDLKNDVEAGNHPILDQSLGSLSEALREEIEQEGVRRRSVEELCSGPLKAKVKKMVAEGVKVDYVVTTERPRANATTVVLFTQYHPAPKEFGSSPEEDYEIKRSQDLIMESIRSMKRAKGVKLNVLMEEGQWQGEESTTMAAYYALANGLARSPDIYMASSKMKIEFGDALRLVGLEDRVLHKAALDRVFSDSKLAQEQGFQIRGDLTDAVLAINASEIVQATEGPKAIYGIVIGGGHERGTIYEKEIPLSELLVYQGFNVVVVDTTTQVDKEMTERADRYYADYVEVCEDTDLDLSRYQGDVNLWEKAVGAAPLEELKAKESEVHAAYENDDGGSLGLKCEELKVALEERERYADVEAQLEDPWILGLLEKSGGDPHKVIEGFEELKMTLRERDVITPARALFMQNVFKELRRRSIRVAFYEMHQLRVGWGSNAHPWLTQDLKQETVRQLIEQFPLEAIRKFDLYSKEPWSSDMLKIAAYNMLWLRQDAYAFTFLLTKDNLETFRAQEWWGEFIEDVTAKFPGMKIE